MKRFLLTFAAMLLVSVGAFAQSSTPLKGDVNEDGVVDVGDITAVIGIIKNVQEHYFYLGTIKPTTENYKIIPGATTSYTSFDEAVGTNVSVDAGQTLYMLCPAEWVKGKTVVLEDNSGETLNFSEEIDYTTVSGYAIYKTQVLSDAKVVTLKGQQPTYYFSIGTTEVTSSNYTTANNATTAIPTTTTYTPKQRNYHYILTPDNKTLTFVDDSDNAPINFTEQTSIIIPNHKVYKTNGPLNVGGVGRITLN